MRKQHRAPATKPIRVLAEAIRDADQSAVRAMREAAFQLDRGKRLTAQLQQLQERPR
jgi:phage shock protein A